MNKNKIVLGIGGASGSLYAKRLLEKLSRLNDIELGVVMSKNAMINWELENGDFDQSLYDATFYTKNDFYAPFASGSARYNTMIICPCSMGIIGRVASGVSDDLMSRAADVILKERRKLILVPREAPYSLIHLRNMTTITEAGGIICPATPSFYSKPTDVLQLVDTVVDRVLDLAGLDISTFRWGD